MVGAEPKSQKTTSFPESDQFRETSPKAWRFLCHGISGSSRHPLLHEPTMFLHKRPLAERSDFLEMTVLAAMKQQSRR